MGEDGSECSGLITSTSQALDQFGHGFLCDRLAPNTRRNRFFALLYVAFDDRLVLFWGINDHYRFSRRSSKADVGATRS